MDDRVHHVPPHCPRRGAYRSGGQLRTRRPGWTSRLGTEALHTLCDCIQGIPAGWGRFGTGMSHLCLCQGMGRGSGVGTLAMTVYVDTPMDFSTESSPRCFQGVKSCHMYADTLEELHAMAFRLALRRDWFQNSPTLAHCDLVPSKRAAAVRLGAVEQDRRQAVAKWRELRKDGL
jgi:hypothetical protein